MSTAKKTKGRFIILIVGLALSWGVYECKYYYSYWSDLRNKPWAYSNDKNAKLLVGQWIGNFQDPDNIEKTIIIEIYEPLTEDEREAKAGRKWKRRSYKNTRSFDGAATVKSRLGTEQYKIYGSVEKEDFHKLHFNSRPKDEGKRVLLNFSTLEANNGNWHGDELTITFHFSYQRADGSAYSSSDNPRFDRTAVTTLKRHLP